MLNGPEAPRHLEPAADGLFGEGSAVWSVHGDASMLIGAIRSLVFQSLHPPTMAGVADHSDYRSDPLGRLQRTGQFLATVSYGSSAEAEQAIAALSLIHDRVTGVTPDGTPYRANDPHLLGWVHATEVDSFLVARRRFGSSPLSDEDAERYVAEMATLGERLGVDCPPRSTSELESTLRSYASELAVNHQTREALRFLVAPPLPTYARAPYAVLFAGAVSSLPPWVKGRLWLPPAPITERIAIRPAARAMTRVLGWAIEGHDQHNTDGAGSLRPVNEST
jgi:uncharacterized protein (DUF2236 family)